MIANLDTLKSQLDIIFILESLGLEMRRVGSVYSALCPLHIEKTPSFIIHPFKKIWKCYGCGKSGDIFNFLQELKGVDFKAAIEEVAKLCNFALEYDHTTPQEWPGYAILQQAHQLFKQALEAEPIVLEYLAKRGLSEAQIQDYGLGYAHSSVHNALLKHYPLQALEECGLPRGFFDWRILYPLKDFKGRLCGFSGGICIPRTPFQKDLQIPKYKNSKESRYFSKSGVLWNLDRARPHIIAHKQVIICEGFLDVAGFEKWGYNNAVCCVGTAFTLQHLEFLRTLNVEICFCFDQDSAGEQATSRALEMCFKHPQPYTHTAVIKLAEGLKDMGEALLLSAKPPLLKTHGWKYYARGLLAPSHPPHQRDTNYKNLLGLIKNYPPFLKDFCLSTLGVHKPIAPQIAQKVAKLHEAHPGLHANPLWLEGRILATMLIDRGFCYTAKSFLSKEDFSLKAEFEAICLEHFNVLAGLEKRFKPLELPHQEPSLKAFKIQALQASFKEAFNRGDLQLAFLLQKKLSSMLN
ncbi:CHC2 zinc finger domain-containing protein [Helicobacter vulpis]|uniref:CHC2 zinc finger domain-containing protein n=1 Tax=Helicobacter vulpis TaxID=2316076 RepID=UPI000EAE60D4|nr:CHC2 zinc finger domain-containing protein [Helicobacter vulpis]